MSHKSIQTIKLQLLDFADNLDSNNFSAMSSGVGLGEVVPKMERAKFAKQGASSLAEPTSVNAAGVLGFTQDNQKSPSDESKVAEQSFRSIESSDEASADLSQVRKQNHLNRTRARVKKPSAARNLHKTPRKMFSNSLIVAHLVDLIVATLGFLVVFLMVVGADLNWDRGLMVAMVGEFGLAYVALFSYGAFILYHFVFRMFKIPSLGQIITKRKESITLMSPKAKGVK